MSRRQTKKLAAARHDSRRFLKRHPPRRSAPPREVVDLARRAVEDYPHQRKLVWARIIERATPPRRRGPSAEDVLIRSLPGGITGDAFMAVERVMRRSHLRLGDPELIPAVARDLWMGGVQIGHKRT